MTTMRGAFGVGPAYAPETRRPPRWWEQGECDRDARFQKDDKDVTNQEKLQMRGICHSCPVAAQCLADTIEHRDAATFRSGWTAEERRQARRAGRKLFPGGPTVKRLPPVTRPKRPWTPEEDALLQLDLTAREIAVLTNRTKMSVDGRRTTLRRLARERAAS